MMREKKFITVLLILALLLSTVEMPYTLWNESARASAAGEVIEHYLTPYQTNNMDVYDNDITESFIMMNETYYQGITTTGSYSDSEALYNLDSCIDRIEFLIGHRDNYDDSSATLYIYADGVPLQTVALSSTMITQEISLNVTGVRQLKIYCERSGSHPRYGIANVKGYGSHLYEREIIKEATMQQTGMIRYSCRECDDSYTETIPFQLECVPYLHSYQTSNMTEYDNTAGEYFYEMGRKYSRGLAISASYSDAEALYNLDKQYERVSFSVGHLDDYDESSATLYIYLDDVLLQLVDLRHDMVTQDIELDVTGVQQLKLVCERGGSHPRYGITDMKGYGGHLYEGEIIKIVTAQQDGKIEYSCQSCGDIYTETIPAQTECIPYLQPYQTSDMSSYYDDEGEYFYVMGKRYDRGLTTSASYSDSEALYNLSKQYSSVSFTIGHRDNYDESSAILYVYCDGSKIKEMSLDADMISQSVTVDTQNVVQLQIKIVRGGSHPRYAIYDMEYDRIQPLTHSFQMETDEATGNTRYVCENCDAFYTDGLTVETPTEKPTVSESPTTQTPSSDNQEKPWFSKQPSTENSEKPWSSKQPSTTETETPAENATKPPATVTKAPGQSVTQATEAPKKDTTPPARVRIKKIQKKRRGYVVVKFSRVQGVDGYDIQYSRKRNFSKKNKELTFGATSKKLYTSAKKIYYIRVRAYKYGYKNGSFGRVNGRWSSVKKVKTKK